MAKYQMEGLGNEIDKQELNQVWGISELYKLEKCTVKGAFGY